MFSLLKVVSLAVVVATSGLAAPAGDADLDILPRQTVGCPDVKVYYARDTGETGTLGTFVGPPFSSALRIALGSKVVDFQGLEYPANVPGYYAGGDADAAVKMANDATNMAKQCIYAKIALTGYGQGGQVVHKAAALIPPYYQDRINAVVTFGDPDRDVPLPGGLESRRVTYCAVGDSICSGQLQWFPNPFHFGYRDDTTAAAAFVAAHV